MNAPSQKDPLITLTQTGLLSLARELSVTFDLEAGDCMVIIFEIMADIMRARAMLEFDEYLAVFSEEIKKMPLADQDRLDVVRFELADIIELTAST